MYFLTFLLILSSLQGTNQGSTGYRTIMSYNASGHNERVNYFSNPNVNLPQTGTVTGEAGISNNAAVLTKNRFNISAVGDESGKCDHGPKGKIDGKITTSSKKIISGLFPSKI